MVFLTFLIKKSMVKWLEKYPYLALLAVFALVYALSLTFVYVEGDDAATIAFHALGRDTALQGPYSPYHGMMDVLLGWLPANEPVLRIFSILISAISAFTFVALSTKLINQLLPAHFRKYFPFIIPLIPIVVPELLFFGLIYMTSTLAMSLLLFSHLITRKYFQQGSRSISKMFLGALIFGLGCSFRWDVAVYGIVIFIDLVFLAISTRQFNVRHNSFIIAWSITAISSVLLFIYISGYDPVDIIETIRWAKQYVSEKQFNLLKSSSVAMSLFTPFAVLTFTIGIIMVFKQKNLHLMSLGIIGFLPKLYLGFSLLPKGLIMAIPGFLLLMSVGISSLFYAYNNYKAEKQTLIRIASFFLLLLLVIPWFFGLRMKGLPLTWGPGFQRYAVTGTGQLNEKDTSPSLKSMHTGLYSGFAFPSPEGPRPAWGYAYVLLGGDWRNFALNGQYEREHVVDLAEKKRLPILQENEHSFLLNHLLAKGYNESTPMQVSKHFKIRELTNDTGVQKILIFKARTLFDPDHLREAIQNSEETKFICWFLESNILIRFKSLYPEQVEIIGPTSAIIDLGTIND